ncbi:MAG: acetyl-CoA carboxylase carboxyltransferase subunit alpha [Gammaproteobacteria bacterium GWE2_42_36]|nr:MAG: acetyl-CoA carboxylase carboxyltransferase subunit alpha [Gammaproteobacteria bacterium GWE2_42_36]HCU05210.1 acetyl-CoA carboxylase carboxyl transferase subunit alpha [Coxiellaceae bacterium]
MNLNYLDFEQSIAELESKVAELRALGETNNLDIQKEISQLEEKNRQLTKSIFAHLKTMQIVQVARHPMRPYTLDYIERMFTEFDELHGDRHISKGPSIIGGVARLDGKPVIVLGHQKGRKTQEKLERNFGMPHPEDYRKTQRLMTMAEKFHLPVLTFIDTAGAYPGLGGEERNQSEAIARNLSLMSQLKTPIICTIVGEGGSGGAIALGVGDRLLMLQYSVYSVISPEGCASILWKNTEKTEEAAEALGITATRLKKLGFIDQVIEEPLGGAHRNYDEMAAKIKRVLIDQLAVLEKTPLHQLLRDRYQRLMNYGIKDAS